MIQSSAARVAVEGAAHLDVVDIEHAVVALVLVPPVGQSIRVLIDVDAIDERVAVGVDVEEVHTVVRAPSHDEVPVELRYLAVDPRE